MPTYNQFNQLLDNLGITNKTDFAKKLGTNSTTISNTAEGKSIPRVDLIEKLKELYPDLNLNWLIAGEGKMWLADEAIEQGDLIEENRRLKARNKELERDLDLFRESHEKILGYVNKLEGELKEIQKRIDELPDDI